MAVSGQPATLSAMPMMSADGEDRLDRYNRKRDFSRTAEPPGVAATSGSQRFVIQKHAARRLHWDFRLEIEGVLVSWAVPKGPSLDPAQKRLAVRTEDHPLEYADFEGDIPAGEYGGGHVDIWDEGKWMPLGGLSAAQQLAKGHLHFQLLGARLHGNWNLIRMHGQPKDRAENWLLLKEDDDVADPKSDVTALYPGSVRQSELSAPKEKTGQKKSKASQASTKRTGIKTVGTKKAGKLPDFVPVQLATLTDTVPDGPDWLHEMKYDGYRCLLAIGGGQAVAYTRNGLNWSDRFVPIVEAAQDLPLANALIDGEIVVLDSQGRPDFAALQTALKGQGSGFVFFAFDLLQIDGADLKALPLIDRKHRLCAVLDGQTGAIRYADHIIGEGRPLFDRMCAAGLEGIISKRMDAPYRSERTTGWRKIKCALREEFIIAGWTETDAPGRPFGALALAQYEEGALHYRGRVGTGFGQVLRDGFENALHALPPAPAPLGVPRSAMRGVHWVAPQIVAEIAYATRTADGLVRHARFVGLRSDKPAEQVEKEATMDAAPPEDGITITHPERTVFPGLGVTKGDVADYYRSIAPVMLQSTAGRPISLIRCPDGIEGACFFQRHDAGGLATSVRHVDVADSKGKTQSYLYTEDAAGLVACVQMGAIEFHGWGCLAQTIDAADRIVFDLDPDTGLDFAAARQAAVDLRDHLKTLGLHSRPLLSGGKGIHVVVPLDPPVEWETAKAFARGFARTLAEAEPDRFIATASKAKRAGRIFIDWLRNQKGATSVEPYSLRARPGAPVAAPVDWRELPDIGSAAQYSIHDLKTLLQRAKKLRDWKLIKQSLPS